MKWHKNHTVCNNCHMQKSRGSNCPVCKKIYKLSNVKGMTACTGCKRYVHNSCDKDVMEKTGKDIHTRLFCLCNSNNNNIYNNNDCQSLMTVTAS